MIDYSPVNQVIVEGAKVILHCNATGNPAPNITWTKEGNSTLLYQGEMYSIVNIQRQAAGDYTCTAWNGVGKKTNATATVTVHCELIFAFINVCNFPGQKKFSCLLAGIGSCEMRVLGIIFNVIGCSCMIK